MTVIIIIGPLQTSPQNLVAQKLVAKERIVELLTSWSTMIIWRPSSQIYPTTHFLLKRDISKKRRRREYRKEEAWGAARNGSCAGDLVTSGRSGIKCMSTLVPGRARMRRSTSHTVKTLEVGSIRCIDILSHEPNPRSSRRPRVGVVWSTNYSSRSHYFKP